MRIRNIALAAVLLSGGYHTAVSADLFDKSYVVLAPAYNDIEVDKASASGAGVTFAVGTEIHPQWYAELGVNLASSDFQTLNAPDSLADSDVESGIDASGLSLSFLGKAQGQSGELFYKLGVMVLDYQASARYNGEHTCSDGQQQSFTVTDGTITQCDFDDNAIAGVIGAGFDFFVGYRGQVRLQFEHVRGENDIQINSAQLGYRYNF